MQFKEKFIAYVDVLGFGNLVEIAESGTGVSLAELLEMLKEFGSHEERNKFAIHGPTVCPHSSYLQRDLDFRLTQISDCVIISSEVSPAGVINLVNHCWGAIISLLQKGIMCRGYITRGTIFHTDTQMIGTGYNKAYGHDKNVMAFKREANERGTPFVEVDRVVCDYVSNCNNQCVKEMFSRCTRGDGETVALFPFQRLAHSFVVAGFGRKFDAAKEKRSNQNIRLMLEKMKKRVMAFVDMSNPSAVKKAEHYILALNAQLTVCDETDEIISGLWCSEMPQQNLKNVR